MTIYLWEGHILLEPEPTPKPIANHEDCCCPGTVCSECSFSSVVSEWKVDLGAGGWTDDACTGCDTLSGEYLLDNLVETCWWNWIHTPANTFCSGLGDFNSASIAIQHVTAGRTDWAWEVRVSVSSAESGSALAVYRTADTTSEDCWFFGGQGSGDKISVPQVSDDSGALCNGTLPDPINIWVP